MLERKPRALIVDDEEDLCLLMQMTLHKMRIDSEIAYNLKDAYTLLQQKRFDFCLTDLNLPDGTGMSLVEHGNEHYPNMPIAVITAHGSVDLAIEALKVGAFDFVNKPLELPRLRQLIENALKVEPIDEEHEGAASGQMSLEKSVLQSDNHGSTPATKPKKKDISKKRLLGESPIMDVLRKTIKKLARSQAPVFLQGQSGTGKEVVASLIHELSPRASGSFVPVNCGAIPSELMESEFFGHKKGSFTGATNDKKGLFQMADKGTLFLDEVADLPLNMQVKLLRAIQEKKVRPIGGQQEIPVDIRLLSATHKNLAELVQQGKFRQDLYYRINVIELKLPSLNERGNDVSLLADHFIQQISADWETEDTPLLSDAARQALLSHQYQGNVRELRNILERALTLCDGDEILPQHLQLESAQHTQPFPSSSKSTHYTQQRTMVQEQSMAFSVQSHQKEGHKDFMPELTVPELSVVPELTVPELATVQTQNIPVHTGKIADEIITSMQTDSTGQVLAPMCVDTLPEGGLEAYLECEEKRLMLEALERCRWNRTRAAEKLGMSFRSFRYKMKKLNISDSE